MSSVDNADNTSQLYVDVIQYPTENTFVAECLDIPVIVEGHTIQEVKEKMRISITGYFEAFPKEQYNINKRTVYSTPRPS
jgi:predicted RNase H-like HicB family nuclease